MEKLFTKESIQTAINDYQSVVYKEDQRSIIESLSKVICSFVEMNEIAMRGFMIKAIGIWQQKHKLLISDVIKMNKDERVKHVSEMFNYLKQVLSIGLNNRLDENKISTSVDKALKHYIDNFSGR